MWNIKWLELCKSGTYLHARGQSLTRRIVRERGAMSDVGNRFRALDVLRGLTLALMIVTKSLYDAGPF
jgi:uncharacterized membrane protein